MRALHLALAVALAACGKQPPRVIEHRAQPGDVAIVDARIVPMDREGELVAHTILIRGDRIVAVAPSKKVDTTGATIIDAPGQWVMPGLADMHVHAQSKGDLALFVLNGVTTVRDLFGFPEHLRWRDDIGKGALLGPTLLAAGPIFDGDPPVWPGSAVVTTPDAARAEVRKQKAAGYDWIKVYSGLSREVYDAILDEAKQVGLPVAGHVPKAVGVEAVLAGGGAQRTIEHLDGYVPFFGDPPAQSLVEPTVKSGVWNCPTLVVTDRFAYMDDPARLAGTRGLDFVSKVTLASWDPKNDFRLKTWTPEMFARHREKNAKRRALVGELQQAGARLVLGTDTGNPYVVPGFAVVDELGLLVASGLTPAQALRAATVAAAEVQGTPGAFGVIAPGARADLIILDGDPLADVRNAADPVMVILRGTPHARTELLEAARPPAAPADRFAGMPALEAEGTPVVSASYDVLMLEQPIGGERVVLSTGADGATIIRGQAAYTAPQAMHYTYRATRDALDVTTDALDPPHLTVVRQGGKVVATQDGQAPVELAVAAGAVIAPQTIAEQLWYVAALADLEVGKARTLTAAEVTTDGRLDVVPGSFTFTRAPDADGRKVYAFTGTHGRMDVTGQLVVDPDGAPREVSVTVKYGTFITRRLP